MKTLKIAGFLSLLTLSANAGMYFNAGLGMEKGKLEPKFISTFGTGTQSIKTSGSAIQLGLGYAWNFANNTFAGVEFNIDGLSSEGDGDKMIGYPGKTEAKMNSGWAFIGNFGYKINDKFSAYAKLGYGANNIEVEAVNVGSPSTKLIGGDVGGLTYGLGGAYNLNIKSAVYLELMMKDYKGTGGALVLGSTFFDTEATYKATNITVGYRYFF